MTALAWLLLGLLVLVPLTISVTGRPKPTRCPDCGGFKLPRAVLCFDCTTR